VTPTEKILAAVITIQTAVLALIIVLVLGLLDQQDRNNMTILKNRAAICRMQLGIGLEVERNCLDPEVIAFYDPSEQPQTANGARQRLNTKRICDVLSALGAAPPDCTTVPG